MLTFFTTAKPFVGHSGIIQRNALKSWTLLGPDVEVILFGDEEGAAEIAEELRFRHAIASRRGRGSVVLFSWAYATGPEESPTARRELAAVAGEGFAVPRKAFMKTPFFTVLIDAYNYGQYVEDAVSSVLAQNFPSEEREILVVDDGSTDDTVARLRKFGNAIRYLHKPNGGQASAFNYGFQHARGEVVALLDADDAWLPEKLERVYEAFERDADAGMVYHRLYWWDGVDNLSANRYFVAVSGRVPESRRALLQYPMASTSCLAFRRAALEKLLPVPEALRSQADAYLTALVIFVAPVVAITEYLGKYRLHGTNLFQSEGKQVSREQIEHRMAMRTALLAEIEKWLRAKGHNTRSADLRAYLTQWKKALDQDGFALQAPGRWKYFRHLLGFPRTYSEIMTRRHRVYSHMRAYAALVLGYHHLHLFDDARRKRKKWFAASPERSKVAMNSEAKAAAATKS